MSALISVVVGALVLLAPPQAQAAVQVDDTPDLGWGVNGRVYATVVVGDTVIVGGSFRQAVAPNGSTVDRRNLAAFSLSTGALLTGWRADAGSTVRALAVDGDTVWVGGAFSRVAGRRHVRLARISAGSGAVDDGFTGSADGTVRALAVDGSSLYAGGVFRTANGQSRDRIAKFDRDSGSLDTTFRASANDQVWGLAKNPTSDVLYVSGRFRDLTGSSRNGVGAVSATTGATTGLVFANAARPTLGLTTNPTGTRLFGAGGSGTNSAAAWNTTSGARTWRHVTDGDIQAVAYYDGTVYFGFHDGYQGDGSTKLLAANADTGQLQPFSPRFNNFWGVFAIAAGPGGVVAGGDFSTVSGVRARNLARFVASDGSPPRPEPTVTRYLDSRSAWSYWDADTRLRSWKNYAFNSNAWPTGLPQLGYGDGDETTVTRTARTVYFRVSFTVTQVPDTLTLELLADDGAVVYLNGARVVNDNMRSTGIGHNTSALSDRSGGAENALRPFDLNPGGLRTGNNVLAVEVHQSSAASNDLGFDLNLDGGFDS